DDGEAAVIFRRDRGEAAHDAPDGAEQADEGRDRADRRQRADLFGEAIDFARDRAVHRDAQTLARAFAVDDLALGRPPPFADPGAQHLRARQILAAVFVEEFV